MTLDTAAVPIEIDWDWLRERMVACPWSPQARDGGIWAIDVLQAELGPKWPKAWRGKGAAPPEIASCWFLLSAYAYTLDLALAFAILRDRPGIASLRSVVKQSNRAPGLPRGKV